MKLKKIASLALAGIMAVSMLAGCSTNNGGSSDNGNTVVEPTTTTILDALNKGQDAKNEVKITFTTNSNLDAAMVAAAKEMSADSTFDATNDATVGTWFMQRLQAFKPVSLWQKELGAAYNNPAYKFYDDTNVLAFSNGASVSDVADVTLARVYVVRGGKAWTEESAIQQAVNKMNDDLAALKTDDVTAANTVNNVKLSTTNNKYHTYDYSGNVSMVSREKGDGTTDYYIVMVITQSVTEAKYEA